MLPEDIIKKVRQDFAEDEGLCVLQTLKASCEGNPSLFSDRILRCVVVLAQGRLKVFNQAVALAHQDWKELISPAEYHSGNCVRLLSVPFGKHPDIELFKRWFTGQQIEVPWAVTERWIIDHSDIRSLSLEQVHQVKVVSPTVLGSNFYLAVLRFLFIRGPHEISASKAMDGRMQVHYQIHLVTNNFKFQKFSCNPKDLGKRGKW